MVAVVGRYAVAVADVDSDVGFDCVSDFPKLCCCWSKPLNEISIEIERERERTGSK